MLIVTSFDSLTAKSYSHSVELLTILWCKEIVAIDGPRSCWFCALCRVMLVALADQSTSCTFHTQNCQLSLLGRRDMEDPSPLHARLYGPALYHRMGSVADLNDIKCITNWFISSLKSFGQNCFYLDGTPSLSHWFVCSISNFKQFNVKYGRT